MKADQNGLLLPEKQSPNGFDRGDGIDLALETIRSDPFKSAESVVECLSGPARGRLHALRPSFMSFVPFMLFLFRLLENVMKAES